LRLPTSARDAERQRNHHACRIVSR
jgi:hypothetical protein